MKISKEIRIGLMAIVAIILLIFGYNFLKGKNLLEDSRTFYAVYKQVEGLSQSSAVTINGLQVGSVVNIKIRDDAQLVVAMNIKNEFPFSKTSVAKIYGGDLIGGKSIAIEPDFENPALAKPGDTLNSKIEAGLFELVNDQLSPLQAKVENAVSNVDTLLSSVNYVLDPSTKDNLKESITGFNTVIRQLEKTTKTLDKALNDNLSGINTTLTNASEISEKLNRFSDTLTSLELNKMITNIEETIAHLNGITAKIDNGEGSLGKLINDEKMYTNLENATKQMEELLQDIKLNPKRYVHFSVFGKNNREYEEPEAQD